MAIHGSRKNPLPPSCNVSHSDELSVAVPFVDSETLEPEERLVRVSETNDKTGEGQAKDIVKSLQIFNIPLSTIQFQTYDSTASMSGVHNGAPQKLNEILERKIPYASTISACKLNLLRLKKN